PTTGVKEGEFATAKNAGSIPEKIRAAYNNAKSGQYLSEKTRNEFLAEATKLYEKAGKRQSKLIDYNRSLAERYSVNPENVALPFEQETMQTQNPTSSLQNLSTEELEKMRADLKARGK